MAKRRTSKKKVNVGIKALGEKDVVVGIALLILGGILATVPRTTTILWLIALVLSILGIVLTGFGINNYLRN